MSPLCLATICFEQVTPEETYETGNDGGGCKRDACLSVSVVYFYVFGGFVVGLAGELTLVFDRIREDSVGWLVRHA